jgi:hypothetical protein
MARRLFFLVLGLAACGLCQLSGGKAYEAFRTWRNQPVNAAIEKYRANLWLMA